MTTPTPKLPEPALVRSVLVTLTAVAAYLLNRQVDTSWVEPLLTLYTLVAPLIAGLLIRHAVRPVKPTKRPRPAQDN
ncbi:hypothetical protein NONI108955_01280 [Nocardia ninae]|uniref:Uncharacterized protein n=1 Tax=Nocardia ninae NBRC 108245 TaxID=1210091 RepID=A0A511MCJ5_9NOCA|nr:hypothetical protein [Nocardia ninae]GEM38211.1 hypothetical protein NN4_27300 [Nocardia ninae NBRC 108245]